MDLMGTQQEQTTEQPPVVPDQGVADANNGFFVGVDERQPPPTPAQVGEPETAVGNSQVNVDLTGQTEQRQPGQGVFTQADIEKVRREEKDKLYGQIDNMKSQLSELQKEREARLAAEQKAIEEAEQARKAEELEKMTLAEKLEAQREEFESRLGEVQQSYEADKAIFEKERRLNELDSYKRSLLEQNEAFIMPELRDLVSGNNEQEIEASVEELKSRTATIISNMTEAASQQRQSQRGVSSTAPPVGPLENLNEQTSLTPQDIATMDMETYRKHRGTLLNAASQQMRNGM